MDEGRKRVILISASILAARKLANWDGRPSPMFECAIENAIITAEKIMDRIDSRHPTPPRPPQSSTHRGGRYH